MKPSKSRRHPPLQELALFAMRDMPLLERWRTGRHVRQCAECEHQVEQFQSVAAQVRRDASEETLTEFEAVSDWARLEREMAGNIHVGLAAAECIENVGRHRFRAWRGAAVVAGLSVVFAAGWYLNLPRADASRLYSTLRTAIDGVPAANGPMVRTTPEGIAVRTQGATLTMLHPAAATVTFSLNGPASVGARYIDDDTGEVTITKVYGQ